MSLTDEDKAWIASQLTTLHTDITGRIDVLRTELTERVDGLRTELTGRVDGLRTGLTERIHSLRIELIDRIEKTETTLLTEFHKWASPVELRQRSHAAAMRAFDAELEAVSDRVTKLERPKPPAA